MLQKLKEEIDGLYRSYKIGIIAKPDDDIEYPCLESFENIGKEFMKMSKMNMKKKYCVITLEGDDNMSFLFELENDTPYYYSTGKIFFLYQSILAENFCLVPVALYFQTLESMERIVKEIIEKFKVLM
jgi:hypothetical protein